MDSETAEFTFSGACPVLHAAAAAAAAAAATAARISVLALAPVVSCHHGYVQLNSRVGL